MSAPVIDFSSATYEHLKAQVDSTFNGLKSAWIAHVKAVNDLKASKSWQSINPSWAEYCKDNLPFAAKTYSSYGAEIPLTEIIALTVNTVISPNDSRKIREKFAEIIAPEDKRLVPEIWALSYAYDESAIVPNANTIKAAYEVIKQERDNRSVSINGESFDVKTLAQKMAVREAVLENIQSHAGEKERLEFRLEKIEIAGRLRYVLPEDVQARLLQETLVTWVKKG